MKKISILTIVAMWIPLAALAIDDHSESESDSVIAKQRAALAANTEGKGFGPQSPRDLDSTAGNNARIFSAAPTHTEMNLCNIHFHKYAEHKGGEFTTYAGHGDGKGHGTGYEYDGKLSDAERCAGWPVHLRG